MWSAEKCRSVQSVVAKSQQRGHKYWHHVKTQYYHLGRALQFLAHDTAKRGRKKSWFLSAYFHAKPGKSNPDWPVAKEDVCISPSHKEGAVILTWGSILSGESVEEQRQGNDEEKKRLRRLIWMNLCNVLLRHGHHPPLVPPSFEGEMGRMQEICW